jgi:hypothetical protein
MNSAPVYSGSRFFIGLLVEMQNGLVIDFLIYLLSESSVVTLMERFV